ncbi:MAG: MBL fold metallo-hydrolase, partial [Clostridia bacterium]|nr:MBL fold metallo-hydrolase [Clostridia bacterium]
RPLRDIDLPGHTPGSIALLDEKNRVLYGGDSIQDGRIFMFGEKRDMDKYVESLSLLWETKRDLFDSVFPSHGTIPVGPDLIPRLIDAAKKIIAGESDGREVDMHGHPVKYHDFGFAGFLCSAK